MPKMDLRQLRRLTDDTGILQHAIYRTPDPHHGYCIDDNARGLIAAVLYGRLRESDEGGILLHRYLSFLVHAYNPETNTFRNFLGYDRRWLEEAGSQDSQGRSIWALGTTVELAPDDDVRELAITLFERALDVVSGLTFIRSIAFALLGLNAFARARPDHERTLQVRNSAAGRLFDAYQSHATADWPWWEDIVTYDNAKLPHALLVSGASMKRHDMTEAGLSALRWLLEIQTASEGHLSVIGNQGWLARDGHRNQFDQQPIDAHALVHASLAAWAVTGSPEWLDDAWRSFEWFRGRNDLGVALYDERTGACHDGLTANGVNRNQGAESGLAYLLSVLDLNLSRRDHVPMRVNSHARPVGFATVGAGNFAEVCIRAYEPLHDLKPVAVWNWTAPKARQLASAHNIVAYSDLHEMLNDPSIEVVHIASTPERHAEHTLAALRAGKHVLCEKPLAIHREDARTMMEAANQRNQRLAVNFTMRHGPLVLPMKRILDSHVLGAPLRGTFTNRAGDEGLPTEHWFWDEDESGGIFVEHGLQFFDLVRFWLGQGQVRTANRSRRPGFDLVDQVTCDVDYGPQTSVSFYHGFHQSSHLDAQDFRLIFERGEATLKGWIASELSIHAVLDDDQIEELQACIPEAQLQSIRRFESGSSARRHHRTEPIDREILLTWQSEHEKQWIYAEGLRALMQDLLAGIHDPHRTLLVTADDGQVALDLALSADRLAKGITP